MEDQACDRLMILHQYIAMIGSAAEGPRSFGRTPTHIDHDAADHHGQHMDRRGQRRLSKQILKIERHEKNHGRKGHES